MEEEIHLVGQADVYIFWPEVIPSHPSISDLELLSIKIKTTDWILFSISILYFSQFFFFFVSSFFFVELQRIYITTTDRRSTTVHTFQSSNNTHTVGKKNMLRVSASWLYDYANCQDILINFKISFLLTRGVLGEYFFGMFLPFWGNITTTKPGKMAMKKLENSRQQRVSTFWQNCNHTNNFVRNKEGFATRADFNNLMIEKWV